MKTEVITPDSAEEIPNSNGQMAHFVRFKDCEGSTELGLKVEEGQLFNLYCKTLGDNSYQFWYGENGSNEDERVMFG